ncbi:YhgE/Pip family protein [Streptomyces hydrogenans]|uniref:Membrane protein n=1 Tax=Streptomyces hydrogenans TaxID=1873719 RepID=A0ABQ3P958_9ACTN|nr:YhgE/Pip domain-containing protein [Streptomyces hydrogenans]GHG11268.1 membrane protein [Streptomyces hydrogenans]GHI21542.1 membrane protein [Streptomyces hydrogenans]
MRSPKLAALELRRFGRGKLPRAALVAVLLLPLLYGALYLYSFWDPYSRLDRLPVALVNEDRGATADGKRITAGADLTEGLLDNGTFEWHQVGDAEAREGVEDGTYYLSLTVPADFSERIASSSGDSPETGALRVRTNDSNNYIVGQISRTVFSEVRTAASTKSSRTFLDKIFISFSDIHEATAEAAKGAADLKKGVDKAKKGSKDLSEGLTDAKTGSSDLASGLKKLDKGSKDVQTGTRKVANGTQALADKVNGTADKVRPYLANNGTSIRDTAKLVSDSATLARNDLEDLVRRAPLLRTAAHKADDTLARLHRESCAKPGADAPVELPEGVTLPEGVALPDPKEMCAALKEASTTAGDVATVADDVHELTKDSKGDLKTLDTRLKKLKKEADELAARAPHLDEDVEGAIRKINELNKGAKKVADGAEQLHTGITGARAGSVSLDSGVGKLKKGAGDLDGGLFKLADGSGSLATGLKDGVDQIPDYDKGERDRRTEVMADPVKLAAQSLHKAPNYGTGFAPYFIPLSLWVGAMVAYMIIQPMNRRALAAGASAWRIALAGWFPVAAIGVLQVGALLSVLHWGLGLEMARAAGTVGFLALVTCCFAAIIQWLNARFGAAGRILVLALLMVQLTSAGGTYPVQTSPGFFNAVHPFLPMTHVVDALRRLISGGGLGPVWEAVAVLAAYTLGALALTAVSARRKQVWTLDRLHPELSL